jgi:hypothetical protein
MMGIFALFLVSMIISQYYNALSNAERQKKRKAEFGTLQFSGKVVNFRPYRYLNKNYYQICVKIDSVKLKDFLVFNEDDCLSIKNNMATFAAGYLDHILGPADSVDVNMGNSGKIAYYYKNDAVTKIPMEFDPMGLQKSDLTSCR